MRRVLAWLVILLGLSLAVGAAGAGFLHALAWTTRTFSEHHWLLFTLPVLGLLMVWVYEAPAKASAGGVKALIAKIRTPTTPLPASMAPAIVGTTLLSHLGGASVGREGTALQMGGALAGQFARWFTLDETEHRTLLLCGVSAGFAAVFGTPIAAAIFALEFVRLRSWALIPCLACGFLADLVGRKLFHATHANYRLPLPAEFSLSGIGTALALGLACGLVARFYLYLHRRNTAAKSLPNPYGRILFGGVLFVVLVQFGHLFDFTGLGLHVIEESFLEPVWPTAFVLKFLLTFLCVSYGFRGGEVTPLFFVGATLGSAAAALLSLPLSICAALGFVGVFAGAGAVPLACTVMACELFGDSIGWYALATCAISWLVAGRKGLYSEA
jgi:H+/Cl- antiporter ClcA